MNWITDFVENGENAKVGNLMGEKPPIDIMVGINTNCPNVLDLLLEMLTTI